MANQRRPGKYPVEMRERAVRLVRDGSDWEAICAVAEMPGPTTATVRKWVRRAEINEGPHPGLTLMSIQRRAARTVCRRRCLD